MKRVAIVTALVSALGNPLLSQPASAATYAIGSMNITGGNVVADGFGLGTLDLIGTNTNLVGGYIGSGGASVDYTMLDPTLVAGISNWFGFPASFYTASANYGDANSPAGTYTGGPVPGGTLDDAAGTITMDMSSWFINWNDGDYMAGTGRNDGTTSAMAAGTWDPVTHAYSLYWDSYATGPACGTPGCVTHWTLSGTASPVPVPPALWLFGSGLLGLFGLQRRLNK